MKSETEPQLSKNKETRSFTVSVDGHDFRVFIPPGRFVYYARFKMGGKAYLRTLQTASQAAAAARAKIVIRRIKAGRWEEDESKKVRSSLATVGELIAEYQKHAGPTRSPKENAAVLRAIVATRGGDPDKRGCAVER